MENFSPQNLKPKEKVLDSASFFEKIRNNEVLKNTLKIMVVSFFLMRADAFSQDSVEKDRTEQTQNKDIFEKNKKLFLKNEYIVPEKIMIAFSETVDPNSFGVPAGGYFKKNFLNSKEKQSNFEEKLKLFGCSQEEIEEYSSLFENKNIVFNENKLNKNDFKDVLVHERLHKAIDDLSAEDQKILNEARDFIVDEFKDKDNIIAEKSDIFFILLKEGKMTEQEYKEKEQEIKKEITPILLDSEGGTEGLIPILRQKEEFYTYLEMGKFKPSVMDYVKINFPKSFEIFQKLTQDINKQIEESSKK